MYTITIHTVHNQLHIVEYWYQPLFALILSVITMLAGSCINAPLMTTVLE